MAENDLAALVTGGGSGIGRAIALELSRRGFHTLVVGRDAQKLTETCRLAGDRCSALPADLAVDDDITAVARGVHDQLGRLDILVNNAAVAQLLPVSQLTFEVIDGHFAVNVGAPLKLVSRLLNLLVSSPIGQIINVSSEQSMRPGADRVLYGATKAALNYMTRALAAELAASGVRVNGLLPGAVDTEMLRNATGNKTLGTPLGEYLQPTEVASWIGHLIDAENVTGSLITIDGGVSLLP